MKSLIPLLCAALILLPGAAAHADSVGTYKIGSSTEITLDGEEAKADDLKVGMHAYVTVDPLQDGFAASISAQSIGAAPKAAPAAPASKDKTAKPAAKPAPGGKFSTISAVSTSSITVSLQ